MSPAIEIKIPDDTLLLPSPGRRPCRGIDARVTKEFRLHGDVLQAKL